MTKRSTSARRISRIGAGADLRRALDIDVHDDIGAVLEMGENFGFQGAIEVAVDFRVFEEIARGESALEIFAAEEMVIPAVLFAGTRNPSGAGNRIPRLAGIREAAAKRGFPRSRGPGNDE